MTETGRVLVVDTARGVWGAQAYLLRLAEPLARRGYELVLAAPDELELSQAWQARGLPFRTARLPLARSVRAVEGGRLSARAMAREAAVLRRNAGEIARLARAVGAVAIHANGHAVHLDAALAGRRTGIPTVLHLHEEMAPLFGRTLRAAAVTLAPAALAVSRAVADGLPASLARRVEVVPNGVDVATFAPGRPLPAVRAGLGAGADDVLVVAATRLDPEKRIEDLVTAFAPLRDRPGWHLAVVGDTSTYPEYADRVRREARAALGTRVTFTGRREDVADVLRSADVLVHAGVVEGMPLGVLEAEASGLPVVAYRVAGIPEAVVDGRTALLAEPRDAVGLGRHVEALLDDPERRRRMGAAAREHVVAGHDIEGQADRQAELLARVTGRRRGPAGAPRVLLANHWHDDNRGDSAITQGILTLLRASVPAARVTVTTLAENGALWQGSTRHLERFWPGLQARPSPVPTELRGRAGRRSRAVIAADVARWWVRLLPAARGWVRRSGAWRPLIDDADAVVLVGGSNLFDDAGVPAVLSVPRLAEVLSPARAGQLAGKPVLLLGHTLGPFTRRPARRLAADVLARADRVVVREGRSVALARGTGLVVQEAPDMAFAIVPERSPAVERMLASLPAEPARTLVLCARQHPTLGAQADDRLVAVFAAAARELIAAGAVDGVAVVPHTVGPTPVEDDRPISHRLVAALAGTPVALVDEDVSPAELCAFYGAVGAVVAVRLHAAILAVNAGTPTFAVAYLTAKTHGVMAQVGLPDAVADFDSVTADRITAEIGRQLRVPGLRQELLARADARRGELYAAAREWFAVLRPDTADESPVSAVAASAAGPAA